MKKIHTNVAQELTGIDYINYIKGFIEALKRDNNSNNYFFSNTINDKLQLLDVKYKPRYKLDKDEVFLGNYIFEKRAENKFIFCDLTYKKIEGLIVFFCKPIMGKQLFCIRELLVKAPDLFEDCYRHCENLYKIRTNNS